MATNDPNRVIELHRERTEDDRGDPDPIEVPYAMLSPEALQGLLESIALREGTDYGERERTLEQKVGQLRDQLHRREARIIFDPRSETVTVVPSASRSRG